MTADHAGVVTSAHVARYLGVTRRVATRYLAEGVIPGARKIGAPHRGRWILSRKLWDAWKSKLERGEIDIATARV